MADHIHYILVYPKISLEGLTQVHAASGIRSVPEQGANVNMCVSW